MKTRPGHKEMLGLMRILVVVALLWMGGGALAVEIDQIHELYMGFQTPHTDWAQPYAQGRISVLCFGFCEGTNARWIIELMQRFDVEAEAVYCGRREKIEVSYGDEGHKRLMKILERPFDCYVFHDVAIDALNDEEQDKLFQRVSEGAGLVMVGKSATPDERVLKVKNRIELSSKFFPREENFRAYKVSKGRGAHICLSARPVSVLGEKYRVGWEVEYDYWQERLGRAVLWVSGREPRAVLEVKCEGGELARAELPSSALTVTWEKVPAPFVLQTRLRRYDGEVVYEKEKEIKEGAGELQYNVPLVRADGYHADVWARSKWGIECWATTPLSVGSKYTAPSIRLARAWGEVGEEIAGEVSLAEPLSEEGVLRVRLLDRRGRILARVQPRMVKKRAEFKFLIRAWMPMLLRLEAVVMDKRGEAVSSYTYSRVTKRRQEQFNFLVWGYPSGTQLAAYALESMARSGVTAQLSAVHDPPFVVAAYDITGVPYTTCITAKHDENGIIRGPNFPWIKPDKYICWNDEPAIDKVVTKAVNLFRPLSQHGVFVYSLGDEVSTKGSCIHPACIRAYQRYLGEQYGTIEALNSSWGSAYKNFEEIALLAPRDNEAWTAYSQGNYPRWYDRQAFRSYNQLKLCERYARAFRKLDPHAKVGYEGSGWLAYGDDYDRIVRTLGFWGPYPNAGDEIIRSIRGRDFMHGNWMGYSREVGPLLRKYWRMILRGMNTVEWWKWEEAGGQYHGFLAPHLGPYPAGRELLEDTRIVRDGLGTLLVQSEMQDDGIAILYSHPSFFAACLHDHDDVRSRLHKTSSIECCYDHISLHRIIRETGLQFRYVTGGMLRRGEFDLDKFKVLILPRVEAIEAKEAELIKRFVGAGGTLIADMRPGLCDYHLKAHPAGVFDDLFGIERKGNPKASIATGTFECILGGKRFDFAAKELRVDPGVRVRNGKALGSADGTPLVIRCKVGKGQTVLLNFRLASWPNLLDPKNEQAARFTRQLFAELGIRPRYAMNNPDGSAATDVEMVRWRNGDIEIIAVWPLLPDAPSRIDPLTPGDVDKTINISLPRAMHVYDLRRQRHKGPTKTFTETIKPDRPYLYVLTEKPLSRTEVVLSPSTGSPGEVVKAMVRVPGLEGKHAVKIRATTPDGKPAEWLDQTVMVDRRGEEIDIPIAFNDPVGKWTIKATDLYTGEAATVGLTVQ